MPQVPRSRALRLLLLALGAAAVLALLGADPAVAPFLLDADLLILLGTVGMGMLVLDVRVRLARVSTSTTAVLVRAGVSMTWERPGTLVPR